MIQDKNFFDELDSGWGDAIANTYEDSYDTDILVKYDLKKFGLEKFKRIENCDNIIKQYEKNVGPLTNSDEIILTIKLKDINTFDKRKYIDNSEVFFYLDLEDVVVLINDYDITPYLIFSLKYNLGSSYKDTFIKLVFTIIYKSKMFLFNGISVSEDSNIGKITFAQNDNLNNKDRYIDSELEFMDYVTFLNIKIYEPYIGKKLYKEVKEIALLALPNVTVN